MSYILEALKKSEADRQTTQPSPEPQPAPKPAPEPEPEPQLDPEFSPLPPPPVRAPLPVATTASEGLHVGWKIGGVLGLAAVGLAAVYMLRGEPELASVQPAPAKEVEAPKPVPAQPSVPVQAPEPEPAPTPTPAPEPVNEASTALDIPEPPPAPPPVPEPQAVPAPQEKLVATPELTVVDELPPEAQAKIEKSRELAVVTPRNQNGQAPKRSSKPVVITAPKSDPKKATKAQKAKADAQKAQRQINVAWGAIKRGHYSQAVRDLDVAVKLVPNSADAWFARGWAHEKSGKELSAIGDYARAIKSKPDHEFALFSRGYLNLYVGNPQAAITDFARASGVAKERAFKLYTQLWLHLSRTRVAKGGAVDFSADIERENLNTWPGQLVRHVQGKLSEDAVLTAIERGTDAQVREQRCTGFFFLGIQALEGGNTQKARSYFERALATGAVQFRQFDAAKRELERLNL